MTTYLVVFLLGVVWGRICANDEWDDEEDCSRAENDQGM